MEYYSTPWLWRIRQPLSSRVRLNRPKCSDLSPGPAPILFPFYLSLPRPPCKIPSSLRPGLPGQHTPSTPSYVRTLTCGTVGPNLPRWSAKQPVRATRPPASRPSDKKRKKDMSFLLLIGSAGPLETADETNSFFPSGKMRQIQPGLLF